MDKRIDPLIAECRRQEESCLYTSTMLYIWLRWSRRIRRIFVVLPIVLGGLATWSVLDHPEDKTLTGIAATFALLAGLFPAIYEALKLDTHIDELKRQAAQFKNLQGRFRQAATVTALGPFEDFQSTFDLLIDRMDAARTDSITPPEWCYEAARKKIKAGHYLFDSDADGNQRESDKNDKNTEDT